jgi:gluconokinase
MSTVFDEVVIEDRPEIDLSVLPSLRPELERPLVLALDIGSSGVRAALFDGRGEEIDGSQVSLANDFSALVEGADIDVETLFEFVLRAIDVAVARAESLVSQVDYVASCCFWHSLLGVDEQGNAVTPLLSWSDTRAARFISQLRSQFDEGTTHARTGARFHPSYWPAKLLWLRDQPARSINDKTQWLSFSDYLFLRLFGESVTSVSTASATGLFDQRTRDWDEELCNTLGIKLSSLSDIAERGRTFQLTFVDYLARWPLLSGATWFPAIGDGAANNIGAGCVTPDRVALMVGTSGAMRVLFSGDPPSALPSELFCYRADRDRVVVGGALSDGGGLIRWMRDSLGLGDDQDLESNLADLMPDSHGLTVLPFWSGERATGWASAATGSIIGMTARTRPVEVLRATMEAICYRFALIAAALDRIAPQAQLIAAGNALLSSPLWMQMMADVLGRPMEVSRAKETSLFGAALLALEAIGKIDSLETIDASGHEVYEPDFARHEIYVRAVERQQKLYEKLSDSFRFQA